MAPPSTVAEKGETYPFGSLDPSKPRSRLKIFKKKIPSKPWKPFGFRPPVLGGGSFNRLRNVAEPNPGEAGMRLGAMAGAC
ncbi:hypothetical protein V6Z11_D06G083900 [Gossypium hirsutum]